MHFDDNLRFKPHFTKLIPWSVMTLKLLHSNRHILDEQLRLRMCESLILSNFNYYDVLYHHCLDSVGVGRLQKIRNSCLRFIYGLGRRERITYYLQRSAWLNMANRRLLHVACFYHKILTMRRPPYLFNRITFKTDVHYINLRFRGRLTIPKQVGDVQTILHTQHSKCSYDVPEDGNGRSAIGFRKWYRLRVEGLIDK